MTEENLFREVDEELRSDRLRRLWWRFAPYIIGAAVLIVLAVALNEGWSWWQRSNSAQASDLYFSALEKASTGDLPGAQTALNETIAGNVAGYPLLARFSRAALLAEEGKTADAVAAYDLLLSTSTDQSLRDLASLFAGALLVDGGDVPQVRTRIVGLLTPENRLQNAAKELLGLTLYKAGDIKGAYDTFTEITTAGASQDQQQRIELYRAQLVAEGATTPPAPTPADGINAAAAPASALDPASPDAALFIDTAAPPAEVVAIPETPAVVPEMFAPEQVVTPETPPADPAPAPVITDNAASPSAPAIVEQPAEPAPSPELAPTEAQTPPADEPVQTEVAPANTPTAQPDQAPAAVVIPEPAGETAGVATQPGPDASATPAPDAPTPAPAG